MLIVMRASRGGPFDRAMSLVLHHSGKAFDTASVMVRRYSNHNTVEPLTSAVLCTAACRDLPRPHCLSVDLLSPITPAVGGASDGTKSSSVQVLDSEGTIFATAQLVGSEQLPVRALQVS